MNPDLLIHSQNNLRILIGILGMALAILVRLTVGVVSDYWHPLPSISHYFYTAAGPLFTGVMLQLGVFLIIYRGREKLDAVVSTIAGVAAILVALFPTNGLTTLCSDPAYPYCNSLLPNNVLRNAVHYGSASIFFLSMAFMCLFIFTKSDVPPQLRTPQKRIRNKIYRICGGVIVGAIAGMLSNFFGIISNETFYRYDLTYWLEFVAITGIGPAWLVKAEVVLKDKNVIV